MGQLIACRARHGRRPAALIMPSTLSIIINVFPAHERPKAIAIWASVTGAAGALGPVASGYLLGHFWFGSVFLVNVPIIVDRARRRAVPRPEVARSRGSRARPGRRGAVDRRHRRRSSTASSRRRATAGSSAGDARSRSRSRSSCSALFVAWELHVDEPMLDMHYFQQPGVQHRHRRDDPRVPLDVRRDVPHHAVLPARARLQPAVGGAAHAADRADHDRRRAVHARGSARGSARTARSRSACSHLDRVRPVRRRSACTARTRSSSLCFIPLTDGHRAHDVADDGVDHVGRARRAARARARR